MTSSSGRANDPTWSQSKIAKPTSTDPEDDQQADPALSSGSTSKTWDPCADDNFWIKKSSSENPTKGPLSAPSMQWRPKLRADRDISSVAGDAFEGSTSAPSTDEVDDEALREMHKQVTQTLARKGSRVLGACRTVL